MSDTGKAVFLTLIYSAVVFLALGIADAKYSMVIVLFSTATFFMVLYTSWLIERVEKRLKRYVDKANTEIRRRSGAK